MLSGPELLDPGEALHGDVEAFGWRYEAVDVAYETRRILAVGGPVMFAVTAAASLIGNRRAQAGAQRLAAPQWRPLGDLRILATNERLLVFHQGGWASVWYHAIRQAHPLTAGHRLELIFDADPPYALCGPSVPHLTSVLLTVLAGRARSDDEEAPLLPA